MMLIPISLEKSFFSGQLVSLGLVHFFNKIFWSVTEYDKSICYLASNP